MKLLTKPTLLIGGAAILMGASVGALTISQQTPAAEPDPIVQQVNDHEGRITTLEGDQAATETQVQQNTTDISGLQTRTGSTSGSSSTGGTSTQPSQSAPTQPTQGGQPAPAPTPAPAPDPRTIISMSESVAHGMRTCMYHIYDPAQDAYIGAIMQPEERPCLAVGDILSVEQ